MATCPTITQRPGDRRTITGALKPVELPRAAGTQRMAATGRRPRRALDLLGLVARGRTRTAALADGPSRWQGYDGQPDHQRRGWAGPTTDRWW
jgi:hypothetical protein